MLMDQFQVRPADQFRERLAASYSLEPAIDCRGTMADLEANPPPFAWRNLVHVIGQDRRPGHGQQQQQS